METKTPLYIELILVALFVLLVLSFQLNLQSYLQVNSVCNIKVIPDVQRQFTFLEVETEEKVKAGSNIPYYELGNYGIEYDKRMFGMVWHVIPSRGVNVECLRVKKE